MLQGSECKLVMLSATGLSPSRVQHSGCFAKQHNACIALPQPRFHGLGCSHFARRYYGNRFCFLFLWLLRCFSSPGCLLPAHGFSSSSKGCPIRESPDLCLFSTPRSISSITTPFLVSGCLGIHRFDGGLKKPPIDALRPIILDNAYIICITATAGTELADAYSPDTITASSPSKEVHDPWAFYLHAALLHQAFAHCRKFPTDASHRSLGSVSVPVWLIILSDQLLIIALEPFPAVVPLPRAGSYALLTRPPLETPFPVFPVRLACVKHAASVHPEPGSNSP
ncbi:hypothetical protein BC332_21985 [Capsicum chinense]|nr:hypothetical protein BC332_21985 [Capsicum chinense]